MSTDTEEEILRVKLAGATVRVLVTGTCSWRTIEKLIQFLELNKDQYPDPRVSTPLQPVVGDLHQEGAVLLYEEQPILVLAGGGRVAVHRLWAEPGGYTQWANTSGGSWKFVMAEGAMWKKISTRPWRDGEIEHPVLYPKSSAQ